MNPVMKKIMQAFVSKKSKAELATITSKTDVDYHDNRNAKISPGKDYPTKASQYVHRHILIRKGIVDNTDLRHRQMMVTFHPWLKGYLEKVKMALWSAPPIFSSPSTSEDEEPEENKEIQQFWETERLQEAMGKSWQKSMIQGICFFYPMEKKGFFEGYSGPPWTVYSKDELGEASHFVQGHPIQWTINHSNPNKNFPKKISLSQGVFYDYKNTDDFVGEPFGLGIWDILIDWLWITDAVNAFDQRMGNGFFTMVVPSDTDPTQITKYEQIIRNTRTEMGIVVTGSVEEPVELNWVGMSGVQVDFIAHLEKLEDLMAFNMGFPKRWIMGDAEGAMISSGNDHQEVNIQLKNLYTEWVLYVKRILMFYGKITELKDIIIKAPFEMQLSEGEKIALEREKTDMIAAKTWASVNEQRELDGMDAKDEEGADDVMVQEEGGDNPQDKKEDKPSEEKKDAYDILAEIFTDSDKYSIRKIAALTGMSQGYVSKVRAKFDADRQPKQKVDNLVIKQDSVQITDNIYEYEGIVLKPQTKYYEQYKSNCITPKSEIERVFNDPTYAKEFRIGVTGLDDHSSRIQNEVLEKNAIGTVKYEKLTDLGIYGKVRIDLNKTDKVLGSENWIRERTNKEEFIPMSVARWTVDKPQGKDKLETNIDIRSYVATRNPRNKEIGVQ